MNKFTSKAFGLLLLATLVSCGDNGSSNSSVIPLEDTTLNPSTVADSTDIDITTQRKVEIAENFFNYTIFKKYINTWVVVFHPKSKTFANADITCKKYIYGQKQQAVTGKINANADETKLELTINQDDPNKFTFGCEISLDGIIIRTYKKELLKSFVVEGDKNWVHLLGSVAEIETLAFDPGSRLISNGIDVDLKVNQLVSYNSHVVTFPLELEDTTLDDHDGLAGGKIKIHASEAHGKLAFELRGLNGGKRTKIPQARDPLPRDPKLDGTCGKYIRESDYNNPSCAGKNGHKGLKGHTGLTGLKGGDSGSLDLNIETKSLELMVYYIPGLGSNGGQGGEGGLGSPKGLGNTVKIIPEKDGPVCPLCRVEASYNSKKFPDGNPGAKGDPGVQGEKGKDGSEQESVIAIGDVKEIINSFWKNN
ncbi:MAG: collagen-like protein [Bacteriovoracaceae bacterium]|nr:collagen-like protein [Bacteriovoracaceae bacterium]